jgi:hypothetical protein
MDEATIACRLSYGRNLIVYNGMKLTGKFHFKIYMLCCVVTNLVHKLKIHTRSNYDKDVGETDTPENNAAVDDDLNKHDSLTLEMCCPLFNTGAAVSKDNYHMAATCAIQLRKTVSFAKVTFGLQGNFYQRSTTSYS